VRPVAILMACAMVGACAGEPADPQDNRPGEIAAANAPTDVPVNAATPSAEDENDASPATEPAAVPAAFRGTWAETVALCGNRSHTSRLEISERSLRFYESVMEVDRVEQLGPREINVIGTSTGEGTTRSSERHFSLDAAGETLTDEAGGGMVRRRCGG
jgi:hypothetical protein